MLIGLANIQKFIHIFFTVVSKPDPKFYSLTETVFYIFKLC